MNEQNGLLDFLNVLGRGMQPQQGLLSQAMPQQPGLSLRDLSIGLLKANQPSPYKKGFGQLLGEAVVNADQSQKDRLSARFPSAIMEHQYFQSLTPEQQQQYLATRRAPTTLNQGDQFGVLNPTTNQVTPVAKINPSPDSSPALKGAQEEAKAIGDATGKAKGSQAVKELKAGDFLAILDEIDKLLPQSTSGGLATLGRDTAAFFNTATDKSGVDAQLDTLAGVLTSAVPRMEGPQGVLDVKLYEKQAGDLNNTKLPIETRIAAAKGLRRLHEKYAGGSQSPSQTPPTSGNAISYQDYFK